MTSTIERLNSEAIGVTADGLHVPRTLPNEEIEISQDGTPKIVTPSVDRVKPPCQHYKACGGCSLQHASDAFVEAWKSDVVRKALQTKGVAVPQFTTFTTPENSRRRVKFSATRTKKGAMVGFMAAKTNILIPIQSCTVLDPRLVSAIPMLEKLTQEFASRKEVSGLAVTISFGGLDVVIDTDRPLTDALRFQLAQFAQQHGLARIAWASEVIVTIHNPTQIFGDATVVPPSGAFLQATPQAEEQLAEAVYNCVDSADTIIDLFAGTGTFALRLAKFAKVTAVEGDRDMMAALDAGWRKASGLKHVTTMTRDLFRRPLLPDELNKADAIVIDPPRAGALAQFEQIAQSNVLNVASVSCNPISFARDAAVLVQAGFTLRHVWVVDQFRWSPHIEIVGQFIRENSP